MHDDPLLVGQTSDLKLYVYHNEVDHRPHFHFVNMKTNEEGALNIYGPSYNTADHEEHRATLSKEQLNELYDYLNISTEFGTRFSGICKAWNSVTDEVELHVNNMDFIPNYNLMPNLIDINDDDYTYRVGNLEHLQLVVFGKDSVKEPHMHFSNRYTGERGALSLRTAKYCDHDEYTCRLSDELLKEIYDYCLEGNHTHFDFMCASWAMSNRTRKFPKEPPRYDLMNKQ